MARSSTEASTFSPLPDSWRDGSVVARSEPEQLLYRSNLLGSDPRITNYGGGNTSAKVSAPDPVTGEPTRVLWVKGSGGDLGTMELSGFATLALERVGALARRSRDGMHEDEAMALLPQCAFGGNPAAPSIDAFLHAFLPATHVDHLHPDAVIAIAASREGEALTRRIFGGDVGWVSWQRPGLDLALRVADAVSRNPRWKGVVLGGHGLLTWAESSRDCYRESLDAINRAAEFLSRSESAQGFGGPRLPPLGAAARRSFAAAVLPVLRGKVSDRERKVGHFDDSEETLAFVGSRDAPALAARGTSCPDHFLRTKRTPLFLEREADEPPEVLLARLPGLLSGYRSDYATYYARHRGGDSPPMRDPDPVVLLIPGVGMATFARSKAMARQAAEYFRNAVRAMRGASSVGDYVGLDEAEAFRIEYWALEEAKLRRLPPEKELARRVAVVTGAAGGIGRAAAARLLAEGACVVLADIDVDGLEKARGDLAGEHDADRVIAVRMDVTDEASVAAAFSEAALAFGGVDLLVASAGLATAAPYDETTLESWRRNFDVLATGYFLVSREAFRLMKRQATGGSIVFIGSKNAVAASPQSSAYSAAKAAELHLARCLALEAGEHGIRVNVVNPDAVIRGSKIWDGEWRAKRAEAHGISDGELEEHYRKRSLLRRTVTPEDVAEAVLFFASERSSRTTGNIVNVDAGSSAAFPR